MVKQWEKQSTKDIIQCKYIRKDIYNMAKLIYKCNYDGKICNKEIPKVDENGNIIEPKEIDKKSMDISEHCTCRESCIG